MRGVFWNVTPRSLVNILQCCGEADWFHLKVAGSSETSHLYRTSGPYIPQYNVPRFKAVVQISRLSFIHLINAFV